jgi:hypothetical protein
MLATVLISSCFQNFAENCNPAEKKSVDASFSLQENRISERNEFCLFHEKSFPQFQCTIGTS